MAVNPMQRKANNSFLLGIVITLLITSVIIGFLIMQVSKLNKEKEQLISNKVNAYVLNQDVKSGEIIDSSMLDMIQLDKTTIPANAITSISDLDNYSLCDSQGRTILQQGEKYILIISDSERPELLLDENVGQYYYTKQNSTEKIYITFDETTTIAKVDLKKNAILTTSTVAKGQVLGDDVRTQEYNIIALPTQLQTGEFIDIRLRLPNGQDYIVVSHKQVTIPMIEGIDSEKCVWIEMSEVETLNMSSAIVEAYQMNGAKLYATKYVEAGIQEKADVTYLPSNEVIALMQKDPNAVQTAKNELFKRYNDGSIKNVVRNQIDKATNHNDADKNIQEGVEKEIQGLQEERQKYLESMGM